jgi:hypothetical protein
VCVTLTLGSPRYYRTLEKPTRRLVLLRLVFPTIRITP